MTDYTHELINAALPYWEAEAEIARRFFAANPTREQQLFWLRAQIWKELNPVDGYFNGLHKELHELADRFPQIDKGISRHDFGNQLKQMLEEFNHYVLFADVHEFIAGGPLTDKDKVQLAEEKKLQALRKELAASGSAIDRAAVLFTEGGGARLFREGAKVKGGETEKMIAHAMQVIYDDEKDHFYDAARDANKLIASEADARRMVEGIIAVSRQRVAMRSEMFGQPVPQAELDQFIGKIERELAAGVKYETI